MSEVGLSSSQKLYTQKMSIFFYFFPHSYCSKFPFGSSGGPRFAIKRGKVELIDLKVRYTTKKDYESSLLGVHKLALTGFQ